MWGEDEWKSTCHPCSLFQFLFFVLFFPEKRFLEIFSVCAAAILNSYAIYKVIINFQAEDTVTMVTSLCKLLSLHESNVKLKLIFIRYAWLHKFEAALGYAMIIWLVSSI